MLALRVDKKRLSIKDIARPANEHEALVRVLVSGICNTDLEIARGYAVSMGRSDTSLSASLKRTPIRNLLDGELLVR
jgi:threonine dehydrogenase-like Zn-dependent dehydrogenase